MPKKNSKSSKVLVEQEKDFVSIADGMERLWTPQRLVYVKDKTGTAKPKDSSEQNCPFCNALKKSDQDGLIVAKGKYCFALLNLYPYNSGHMLITPFKHKSSYVDLDDNELLEMAMFNKIAIKTLTKVYNPKGFNCGMNLGKIAGAGVPGHVHQHIVPRWRADSNFFPIIGQVRAVSELLETTRQKLQENWNK